MSEFYGIATKNNTDSKLEASKISFAPVAFQVAKTMRDTGMLQVLKHAGEQGLTVDQLKKQVDLSEYSIKILLDAGVSMDLVIKNENNFILTKTGYFILTDKITKINMDFIHDVCYEGLFYLDESIRENEPAGLKVFGEWPTIYHALSSLPENVKKSWFDFDHYYSDSAFKKAIKYIFKDKPVKILDIGGNTGKFSIECCKYSQDVNMTILDLPGQLDVCEKNIKSHNFEDRIKLEPFDLLDHSKPYPESHDIIWMSQFLVCFSEEDVINLLKRAYNAMDDNCSLYILETFPDRQRYEISSYCLNMISLYFTALASGKSRIYTEAMMRDFLDKANLRVVKEIDTISLSHTLLECKKK